MQGCIVLGAQKSAEDPCAAVKSQRDASLWMEEAALPSHANWGTSGASSAAPSEPCTVHKACKWPADAMRWLEALATRSQRHFKRQLSSSPKSHARHYTGTLFCSNAGHEARRFWVPVKVVKVLTFPTHCELVATHCTL